MVWFVNSKILEAIFLLYIPQNLVYFSKFCDIMIELELIPQHDDVIKWKHFPCHWPFVRRIHRSPVNSPHKRQVTRSFDVFFHLRLNKRLINTREAGDLRRYHAHYDVIVMISSQRDVPFDWGISPTPCFASGFGDIVQPKTSLLLLKYKYGWLTLSWE